MKITLDERMTRWRAELERRGLPKFHIDRVISLYTEGKHSKAYRIANGRLCGARTRRGVPCIAQGIGKGHRCRFHGGHSTGPRTPEGKAAVTGNLPRVRAKRAREAAAQAIDIFS